MPANDIAVSDHPSSFLTLPGIKGRKINVLAERSPQSITGLIKTITSSNPDNKEPFYILDLGIVLDLFQKWTRNFPNIQPFYAVKCNTEPALLGLLASLGAGFDCASRSEIDAVLATGVSPDRIVFANTCKPEPHIKYASTTDVNLATFDSIYEVAKIKHHHPKCRLLLRIKAPDENGVRFPFGSKFGALPEEVAPLLRSAFSAGLDVLGVSFHIGSGATDFSTYRSAILAARAAFDIAVTLGGPRMNILNIGGGFPDGPQFDEAATVIKSSINDYFSDMPELVLMAEPGRFFAGTAFTLTTNIIGKRVREDLREYWIDDGTYGSYLSIRNEWTTATLVPVASKGEETTFVSTVYGPTMDGGDIVLKEQQLQEMNVGDCMVSPNMGAYAASMGTNFNGFSTSAIPTYLAYSYTLSS